MYRPTVVRDGKRTKSRIWWGVIRDPRTGRRIRVSTGSSDKAAASTILRQMERERADEFAGLLPPPAIGSLAESYAEELRRRGNTEKYVRYNLVLVDLYLRENSATLNREAAYRWASQVPGLRNRNSRLRAIKSFSRWVSKGNHDPLAGLRGWNEATDRRYVRRALTREETARLLGNDRIPLYRRNAYRLALELGLRAGEIRGEWSCRNGYFVLSPKSSKNRRATTLPISASLTQSLELHGCDLPVRANDSLHWDLLTSGVKPRTSEGVVDFHSLRHTFITRLVEAGVSLAVVQKLARHSDINLTLKRYTHLQDEELRAAMEKVSNGTAN